MKWPISWSEIPIPGSLSKPLSELKIDPNWCFADQNRFSAFYKTSTLQPVENRQEDFEKNPSRDTFSGKDSAHSNAFWLTHWSVRLGLHSMITGRDPRTHSPGLVTKYYEGITKMAHFHLSNWSFWRLGPPPYLASM